MSCHDNLCSGEGAPDMSKKHMLPDRDPKFEITLPTTTSLTYLYQEHCILI